MRFLFKQFFPSLSSTKYPMMTKLLFFTPPISSLSVFFIMYYKKSFLSMIFQSDFFFFLPEIFFCTSLLICLVYYVVLGNKKTLYGYPLLGYSMSASLLFILFITFFLIINILEIDNIIFFFQFRNNFFTNFVKLLIIFASFFCVLLIMTQLDNNNFISFEVFILMGFSILGMFLLISSFDFLSFYLALELQSLCFYVLASIKKKSNFSTEAGLKYFMLGSLASCLILFGIALIYGFSGTTNFADLVILNRLVYALVYEEPVYTHMSRSDVFYYINTVIFNNLSPEVAELWRPKYDSKVFFASYFLGLLLVAVGLFFKVGAAPFHVWVPDVYEGAPLVITAFFAIVPKIVLLSFILCFFFKIFSDFSFLWSEWFVFVSIFSLFFGCFGALYQTKIIRLLAFSAISHVGFLFLGLSTTSLEGCQSVIFYLIIYSMLSILTFSLLFCLRRHNNNMRIISILELKGFFKINPVFSTIFCLNFFSLAGIPPLMGFYSKYYIFIAAIKSELYFIVFLALFLSVISSFYYIRLIKLVFFDKPTDWVFLAPIPKICSFILVFFSLFNIFFFCYPSFFLELSYTLALYVYF